MKQIAALVRLKEHAFKTRENKANDFTKQAKPIVDAYKARHKTKKDRDYADNLYSYWHRLVLNDPKTTLDSALRVIKDKLK